MSDWYRRSGQSLSKSQWAALLARVEMYWRNPLDELSRADQPLFWPIERGGPFEVLPVDTLALWADADYSKSKLRPEFTKS